MSKGGSLFEIIWFVMGGLLLFIGINESLEVGLSESWYYFVFAILSWFMYYRRRKYRLSDK